MSDDTIVRILAILVLVLALPALCSAAWLLRRAAVATRGPTGGPNAGRCWFLHRWSRWMPYEERGVSTVIRGPAAGQQIHTTEVRQHRHCLRCGKVQDEYVKDGPMWSTA